MDHPGLVESILRHIPGFHGYLEKEFRRDSDALQRQWLADRLQQAKRSLGAISLQLVDAGRLPLLTRFDRLRAQLDLVIAPIRGAWQGYSGVFDLVKVNTAVLDQIYEHDLAAMHAVEEFSTTLERVLGQPSTNIPRPIGTREVRPSQPWRRCRQRRQAPAEQGCGGDRCFRDAGRDLDNGHSLRIDSASGARR